MCSEVDMLVEDLALWGTAFKWTSNFHYEFTVCNQMSTLIHKRVDCITSLILELAVVFCLLLEEVLFEFRHWSSGQKLFASMWTCQVIVLSFDFFHVCIAILANNDQAFRAGDKRIRENKFLTYFTLEFLEIFLELR